MCIDCGEDISRRSFLAGVTAAVTGAALSSQAQRTSSSGTEALDDPTITHGAVTFNNGPDNIKSYLARPKKEGRYRGVLVLHGNPGIPKDIRNAAAELAQAGYVGLAIDWNSRTPGPSNALDKPLEFYMTNAFAKQNLRDYQAGIDYLKEQPFVKRKRVGVVGFCGGGYSALLLSTISKDVQAVVAFYAPPVFHPPRVSAADPRPNLVDVVEQIKVPIQCHFGTQDKIIPLEDVRRFEQALRAQRVKAEFFTYEGAGHAFYDFTRANLYNAAAAKLAHERMVSFLKKRLG
ncbi:MAG: dienelactone hydrolase family protein [Acidobacteriota bacterium]|nr:dienelactone hydrolase family protein [Acidobacteriota bacterium]